MAKEQKLETIEKPSSLSLSICYFIDNSILVVTYPVHFRTPLKLILLVVSAVK
jgi:hypothetical protein